MQTRSFYSKDGTVPLYAVRWLDAAYSFEKDVPETFPLPHVVVGFLVKKSSALLHVAFNIKYEKKTGIYSCVDGIILPKGMVLELTKIEDYVL